MNRIMNIGCAGRVRRCSSEEPELVQTNLRFVPKKIMNDEEVVVYECGNYHELPDAPETCPLCDSEIDDSEYDGYRTVRVTCPGWYDE